MKLRLHGNSIRLRLCQTEVDQLARGTSVGDQTRFGPAAVLSVSVAVTGDPTVAVTFDGRQLRVTVPAAVVERWAASDAVSIGGHQDVGGGDGPLSILIEKDFQCLHGERSADAFPNPNLT